MAAKIWAFLTSSGLRLALWQFISYFIVTINFRAIDSKNRPVLLVTDLALGWLAWTIFKHLQTASNWREQVLYMLGGSVGGQLALTFGPYIRV